MDQTELLETVIHDRPCFDPSSLLEMFGDDREFLAEIVAIFQRDSFKLYGEIQIALAIRDTGRLERSAHGLKGMLSNFGPSKSYQLAGELESRGVIRDLNDTEPLVTELGRDLARIRREIAWI
jgi:HPt (histidine-containing phosphotransfer) domain-containing protein